jgi:hypothetical protein
MEIYVVDIERTIEDRMENILKKRFWINKNEMEMKDVGVRINGFEESNLWKIED